MPGQGSLESLWAEPEEERDEQVRADREEALDRVPSDGAGGAPGERGVLFDARGADAGPDPRPRVQASRAFRTSGFMGSPGRWLIVSAAGWGRCRGVRGSGLAVVVVAGSGVGRGLGPVVVVGR